ncbi:MAG: hypothetical protein JWN34_2301 [Bryobacterales bacterium]|nr:hypothetical protein [Bryobacterales bacterium]
MGFDKVAVQLEAEVLKPASECVATHSEPVKEHWFDVMEEVIMRIWRKGGCSAKKARTD